MKDIPKSEVLNFINQVTRLSEADFKNVWKSLMDVDPALEATATKKSRLNAADFSWVDKVARDAVRTLVDKLRPSMMLSKAGSLTSMAAEAIVSRDKLSAEQYEALVGGFRKVGVVVPDQEG